MAVGLRCLGRPLGRVVIAERFSAPADLAAIRLPKPPLDPDHGPISVLLLDPRNGTFRAAQLDTIRKGADLSFGFPAFTNSAGATFLLLAFQPARSDIFDRWQRRLAAAALAARPPIQLACNADVPGFHALMLPPHPPNALHLLGPAEVEKDSETNEIKVSGAIETWWREDGGLYLQGWLHAYERRVISAAILAGREPSNRPHPIPRFTPRPDLIGHEPKLTEPAAGFALFVPNCTGETVTLRIGTEAGPAQLSLSLPARAGLPAARIAREAEEKDRAFIRFVAEANARGFEVLEIGARLVGRRTEPLRDRFPKARRYVGMDIHPGPTVDLVGDVHALSRLTGRGSFDAVFSGAVLEHLAMPWIVAAEINRVLRPGGLTYHITPQAWPVHEEPNDFWRFTDEALKLLFGEPFGFEVLSAGMADRARLYPL
ncbi:MAG TPA: class I SAM-dependent methyltransferase, partial [Acetobacteraceae bacterium]|nr:class I SAM-dependent methyltransferase [Acetobacteraceae bacterium]